METRDDFSPGVKAILAHRAGYRCSRPRCRALTAGPSSEREDAKSSIGVAAHITAASPGGPRYEPGLTQEERRSVSNGLWLCAVHAKEVDDDVSAYPSEVLLAWKRHAEEDARALLGKPISAQAIDITAQIALHRAVDGTLVVTGSTNLPDGTKMFVALAGPVKARQKEELAATVSGGMFAAGPFGSSDGIHPHGWYRVELLSYFNGPWKQPDAVLDIVGREGEFLVGRFAEALHPEFAESEKRFRATFDCIAPPLHSSLPRGALEMSTAIQYVKDSVLFVDGRLSAMPVHEVVQMFMSAPGLKAHLEWSAKALPNGAIVVSYSFWSGARPAVAEWIVVLEDREVRYRNLDAKYMSWGPED